MPDAVSHLWIYISSLEANIEHFVEVIKHFLAGC